VAAQAWERTGFSIPWCKDVGLDVRGMRYARDVRRQLEGIALLSGKTLGDAASRGELRDSPEGHKRKRGEAETGGEVAIGSVCCAGAVWCQGQPGGISAGWGSKAY
jgi:hypothetical protein